MDTIDRTEPSCPRSTRLCGLLVLGCGAAALVGWATKQPILLGLRSSYIPMAPNTALAFVVMGLVLLAVAGGGRWARRLAVAGASVVVLIATLKLFEVCTGIEIEVDWWFYRATSVRFAPGRGGQDVALRGLRLRRGGHRPGDAGRPDPSSMGGPPGRGLRADRWLDGPGLRPGLPVQPQRPA